MSLPSSTTSSSRRFPVFPAFDGGGDGQGNEHSQHPTVECSVPTDSVGSRHFDGYPYHHQQEQRYSSDSPPRIHNDRNAVLTLMCNHDDESVTSMVYPSFTGTRLPAIGPPRAAVFQFFKLPTPPVVIKNALGTTSVVDSVSSLASDVRCEAPRQVTPVLAADEPLTLSRSGSLRSRGGSVPNLRRSSSQVVFLGELATEGTYPTTSTSPFSVTKREADAETLEFAPLHALRSNGSDAYERLQNMRSLSDSDPSMLVGCGRACDTVQDHKIGTHQNAHKENNLLSPKRQNAPLQSASASKRPLYHCAVDDPRHRIGCHVATEDDALPLLCNLSSSQLAMYSDDEDCLLDDCLSPPMCLPAAPYCGSGSSMRSATLLSTTRCGQSSSNSEASVNNQDAACSVISRDSSSAHSLRRHIHEHQVIKTGIPKPMKIGLPVVMTFTMSPHPPPLRRSPAAPVDADAGVLSNHSQTSLPRTPDYSASVLVGDALANLGKRAHDSFTRPTHINHQHDAHSSDCKPQLQHEDSGLTVERVENDHGLQQRSACVGDDTRETAEDCSSVHNNVSTSTKEKVMSGTQLIVAEFLMHYCAARRAAP